MIKQQKANKEYVKRHILSALNEKRKESALKANKRDVESLRKHGYYKEADAVESVGKKIATKRETRKQKLIKVLDAYASVKIDDLTRSSKKIEKEINEWTSVREDLASARSHDD